MILTDSVCSEEKFVDIVCASDSIALSTVSDNYSFPCAIRYCDDCLAWFRAGCFVPALLVVLHPVRAYTAGKIAITEAHECLSRM
jgi:hypothetical protein